MDDNEIIALLFERNQSGLTEIQRKYSKYCYTIANNILLSHEDAEECVNDTLLAVWNSIPPQKPEKLSAYIGKLARNISIKLREHKFAEKRRADAFSESLDELADILPDNSENVADEAAFKVVINNFLGSLNAKTRIIFLRRYWYFEEIKAIADSFGITPEAVRVSLHRTRNALKKYLQKEGYTI